MSSKVSKSDKAKSKFAQSNINFVYKGNTAESHQKPTVRQYGMQIVGKLQGTRRLPPPAWVPSIKAESGGLDSRVALVPAGGSGWGVPPPTDPSSAPVEDSPITGLGSSSTAVSFPIVNGTVSRETIETFEPAYARSNFGNITSTNTGRPNEAVVQVDSKVSLSEPDNSTISIRPETCDSMATPWTRRPQPVSASGGLAANKPFFHRPAPVTVATVNTQLASEERCLPSSKTTTGASEVVGAPMGWAAVGDQEPDFDEKILFSDEEEDQMETKNDSSNRPTSLVDNSGSSTPSLGKPSMGNYNVQSSKPDVVPNQSSCFGTLSPTCYGEHVNLNIPDVWSSVDDPHPFHSMTSQSSSRHPLAQSVEPCTVGTSDSVNINSQYIQRSVPQSFTDAYFSTSLMSNRPTASLSHTISDSVFTGDSEIEMQNVQRQVRTQEFKSAVERARLARQKTEVYSPESEMVHRSLAGLLSESDDSKASLTQLPATHPHGHPPFPGNAFPQLLFSSVYQQGVNQNRPDLLAAVAAAKAVALACNETTHSSFRPSGSVLPSANVHTPVSGPWHDHFTVPPAAAVYNGRAPAIPPVVQGSLPIAPGGPPHIPAATPANAVLLNPQHFVERFLQLLNQQQPVKPQSDSIFPMNKDTTLTASTNIKTSCSPDSNRAVSFDEDAVCSKLDTVSQTKVDELTVKLDSSLKPDTPKSVTISQAPSDTKLSQPTEIETANQSPKKQESKRVPCLMEVKVSTASRHLSLLWDHDDSGINRTRTKFSNDRGKSFSRNKRQLYRRPTEDPKSNKGPPEVFHSSSNDFGMPYNHSSTHTRTWQLPKEARAKSSKSGTASDFSEMVNTNVEADTESKTRMSNPQESDVLSDVSDNTQSAVKKRLDRKHQSGSGCQTFVSASKSKYGPKQNSSIVDYNPFYSDKLDFHRQSWYSRRGRGSHYRVQTPRTFSDEGAPSDSKYNQVTSFRGGHSSTRGRFTDAGPDFRENQNYEDYRNRVSIRADAHVPSRSGQRVYNRGYHQTGSRDQVSSSHTYYRSYTISRGSRRHSSQQTPRGNALMAQSCEALRYGDNFTDEESSSKTLNHKLTSTIPESRSQEEHQPLKTTSEDDGTQSPKDYVDEAHPKQSSKEDDAVTSTAGPRILNQFDESDIPTVRVPATDMGYSSRSSHSRNDGSNRSVGSRRTSARMGSVQQGNKRSGTIQSSRRYRDLRNHYRDDKDGDGGAAAGGAGCSATGTSSTLNSISNQSGSGGRANSSGGPGCGGTHGSNACDHASSVDISEPASESSDPNVNGTNHNNSGEPKVDSTIHVMDDFKQHSKPRFSRLHAPRMGTSTRPHSTYIHRFRRNDNRRFTGLSDQSASHRNVSEIPPLMSIKPVGSFCRNSVDFESHDSVSSVLKTGSSKVDEQDLSDSCGNLNIDSPSDGFTEVVSRSNRKLARRRMNQEIFSEPKSLVNRSSESRGPVVTPSQPERRGDMPQCVLASAAHNQPDRTQSSGPNLVKSKSAHPKPTFMGPPLPIVSFPQPTRATAIAPAVSSYATVSIPVSTWSLTTSASHAVLSPTSQATTRMWSKVVGAKAVTTATQSEEAKSNKSERLRLSFATESVTIKNLDEKPLLSCGTLQVTEPVPSTSSVVNSSPVQQNLVSGKTSTTHEHSGPSELHASLASSTSASPTGPQVSSTMAVSSSALVSNNICKVKPQQQQSSLSSTGINGPVSTVPPSSIVESTSIGPICSSDIMRDQERLENIYDGTLDLTSTSQLTKDNSSAIDHPLSLGAEIFSTLPSPYGLNRLGIQHAVASSVDTHHISSAFWQPLSDPSLDSSMARLVTSNAALPFAQIPTSDVLANIFTGSTGQFSLDNVGKNSHPLAVVPRNQSYNIPPYGNSATPPVDLQSYGLYGRSLDEPAKGPTPVIPQSHTVFPTVAGSMFMSPQQQSSAQLSHPSHPFTATWAMPQNHHPHLSQQLLHSQRYRQRVAPQVEQPPFNNFAYQSKVQNEFSFIPSITGCVQPGSSANIYSSVQGHCQSSFHPNGGRSAVPQAVTPNPWSILTSSSVTPMLAPTQDFNVAFGSTHNLGNNETGLLPHPVSHSGYNAGHCSMPISSSPTPSYLAHQNFAGMIGNERSVVEQTHASMRQRVYPHHSLSRSPNAQGQQSLQVHSAFYPSISPAHQRMHLQQLTGTQGRPAMPGLVTPHNGLFSAPFGAQSGTQPAAPPMPTQVIGPAKLLSPLFHPATWGP